jgi:hypothetical protein
MIYGQDPLFVSAGDFHLQPGSPAINTGTNTGAPGTDIEGNLRALTVADPADMGAYEYTGPLVVAFEVFTVEELKIEVNSFKVEGSFTPASTIDPLTEDVTLKVGGFALTIPAGSFELSKKEKFEFEGNVDGVGVKFEIHPLGDDDYYFEAEFEGVDLSGTPFPVDVTLTIGDDEGTTSYSGELEKDGSSRPVSGLPEDFVLEQNYPNPFNPATQIRFGLSRAGNVTLKIYNSAGQLVKTLVDGNMSEGYHQVTWDATDNSGSKLSSGVYFYRITAGTFNQVNKMMLLK